MWLMNEKVFNLTHSETLNHWRAGTLYLSLVRNRELDITSYSEARKNCNPHASR